MLNRRQFTAAPLLVSPWALGLGSEAWALAGSEGEAANGIRTALERGALAAVAGLGRADGFMGNQQVRIPLPGALREAAKIMKTLGQQKKVDDLVLAMNRAAEAAVPKAKNLLVSTARNISVQDALHLVRGSETAVTTYFADRTRKPLSEQFLPIVTAATEKVSLAAKYNAVAERASKLGLLKGEDSKIEPYVTTKALDGLFFMIAEEEKKIRRDPIGTGSKILRAVFGR